MKIQIEVSNEEIIYSNRGGFEFFEQPAAAYLTDRTGHSNKYPSNITLSMKKDQAPYKKGMYVLADQSVYANKYGQLSLYPILVPVAPQSVQAQPIKAAS